jgi:hypothetical protein
MDAPHWDSNPGSAEVSKRALPASAGKEIHNDPKTLFGGKPVGSVHAPPVEAVLTTTSNEKDSPPRLSPANTTDQHSAQQHATLPPFPRCYWSRATLSFSSPHLNVVIESIGAIVLDAYTTPRINTRASTCTPYD